SRAFTLFQQLHRPASPSLQFRGCPFGSHTSIVGVGSVFRKVGRSKPSHCVVFEGTGSDGKARVFEPSTSRLIDLPLDDLRRRWSGEAIIYGEPELSMLSFASIVVLTALVVASVGLILLKLSAFLNRRKTA